MTTKECRICLRREENCVSLFAKRRGAKLAEIIRFCARVEISEDDGLPGEACNRCVDEALNAYLFVNKCRRSDAELRTAQALAQDDDSDSLGKPQDDFNEKHEDERSSKILIENEEQEVVDEYRLGHELEILTEEVLDSAKSTIHESNNSIHESDVEDVEISLQCKEENDHEFISDHNDHEMHSDQDGSDSYSEKHSIGISFDSIKAIPKQLSVGESSKGGVSADMFVIEYLDANSVTQESVNNEQSQDSWSDDDVLTDGEAPISFVEGQKKYVCCGMRCKNAFVSFDELKKHSNEIHFTTKQARNDEKPFECPICYARFAVERVLVHHSEKSGLCFMCKTLCSSPAEMRMHLYQIHDQQMPLVQSETVTKICCGCYEEFDSETSLRKHSEEEHSIRRSAVDPTRPLQCNICFKLFRTMASLRIHQRTVYKPKKFTCTVCKRAFETRSKLNAHEMSHSAERNFPCGTCDKSFKKEVDLRAHLLLHSEKKEVCSECGMRFHRKSNLKMHMRKHQDTFFYACSECPKKFKNNSHLKEHFKVHSGQKPYGCSFCEKAFAYFSDRKRHEMTHTGDYPFHCETCGKNFTRKSHWNKHLTVCQTTDLE
ncbi:oocyte zinc finger protein XlCOF6-like [Uranotaenia lowii]|uniref:oocyte zinc finger protein XlCOF6-like n=1 Tax=Uranotaenia lowii TaxID=190385 RepID=UPI002479E9F1|nr:oocyte zinc finger protein XlCOF6-like [Uranotaenia lowii]